VEHAPFGRCGPHLLLGRTHLTTTFRSVSRPAVKRYQSLGRTCFASLGSHYPLDVPQAALTFLNQVHS
jgi:hypothetical protein